MSKKSMMSRKGSAEEIAKIAQDYADYINDFGNECAYTDSMLRAIKERIDKLMTD